MKFAFEPILYFVGAVVLCKSVEPALACMKLVPAGILLILLCFAGPSRFVDNVTKAIARELVIIMTGEKVPHTTVPCRSPLAPDLLDTTPLAVSPLPALPASPPVAAAPRVIAMILRIEFIEVGRHRRQRR